MLRHILTTVAVILLPYLVYGIVEAVRRHRRRPQVISTERGYWSHAPVFLLGLIGCLLAVVVLVAVAVFDTHSGRPPYIPRP